VAKDIKLTIHYVETVLSNRRRLREDFKAATEFYAEELAREGDVRGVEV
jgi:DNA-binding SARP family transcriptional activator